MHSMYMPIALIVSALIISATVLFVGFDVSGKLGDLSKSVGKIQITTGSGEGSGSGSGTGNVAPEDNTPPAPKIDFAKLPDDDPVAGKADAKVTIVEFSDFQCPFCGKFYNDAYQQLKKDYIDTGKVKLVYRDFPLGFHPEAQKAAEAGECADDQGKFWQMHDKIFSNQSTMSVDGYKKWAKELGLDSAKFNQCLDSGTKASEVQKDESDGQAAGIGGTPSFFINEKLVVGAQPYSVFKAAIDAELAK